MEQKLGGILGQRKDQENVDQEANQAREGGGTGHGSAGWILPPAPALHSTLRFVSAKSQGHIEVAP